MARVRPPGESPPLSSEATEYHRTYSRPGLEGSSFYVPDLRPMSAAPQNPCFGEHWQAVNLLRTDPTSAMGVRGSLDHARRAPVSTHGTPVILAPGVSVADIITDVKSGQLPTSGLAVASAANGQHVELGSICFRRGPEDRILQDAAAATDRTQGPIVTSAAPAAGLGQEDITGAHPLTLAMPVKWQKFLADGGVYSFSETAGSTRHVIAVGPVFAARQSGNPGYVRDFISSICLVQAQVLANCAEAGVRVPVMTAIGQGAFLAGASPEVASHIRTQCAEHFLGLVGPGGPANGLFDAVVYPFPPAELQSVAQGRRHVQTVSTVDGVVSAISPALRLGTLKPDPGPAAAAAAARAAERARYGEQAVPSPRGLGRLPATFGAARTSAAVIPPPAPAAPAAAVVAGRVPAARPLPPAAAPAARSDASVDPHLAQAEAAIRSAGVKPGEFFYVKFQDDWLVLGVGKTSAKPYIEHHSAPGADGKHRTLAAIGLDQSGGVVHQNPPGEAAQRITTILRGPGVIAAMERSATAFAAGKAAVPQAKGRQPVM